jgi:hypothetical protein
MREIEKMLRGHVTPAVQRALDGSRALLMPEVEDCDAAREVLAGRVDQCVQPDAQTPPHKLPLDCPECGRPLGSCQCTGD